MQIKDMQILVSVRKLKGANLDFLGVGKNKGAKTEGRDLLTIREVIIYHNAIQVLITYRIIPNLSPQR